MRILLIEDNPDDAAFIREEFAQASSAGDCELEVVGTLAQALERLTQGHFDIVLTDLGLPDSQELDTFRRVQKQVPALPIVVLTGNRNELLGEMAVAEGAEEFLYKGEITAGPLLRALRHAVKRHSRSHDGLTHAVEKNGMVIGFVGAKGGVGTTTVVVNVAATLAQKGKRVIAAELRPFFGSFAAQFGINPVVNLGTLLASNSERLDNGEIRRRVRETALPQHNSGVRVLCGPQRPEQFKDIDPRQADELVKALAEGVDLVLLDLHPFPSPANQAILARCDRLVLVVEREITCLAATSVFQEFLGTFGGAKSLAGIIVINRAQVTSPLRLADIRSRLNCPLLGVVPPAPDLCYASNNRGIPLVIGFPAEAIALNLVEIASRVGSDQVVQLQL